MAKMEPGLTSTKVEPADIDAFVASEDNTKPIFSEANGKDFNLRCLNYMKKKRKEASEEGFYEIIACDLVRSESEKISHIAKHINLPKPRDEDNLEAIRESGLPRLFICNIQVPIKLASLFGGKTYYDKDPGLSFVAMFSIKPEAVEAALNPEKNTKKVNAQLALLKRYNQTALSDPDTRRRFKGIVFCENWDHFKLKALNALKGYNGKPAICNKIGEIYQDEDKCEYLEVDVHIRSTKYLARKGLDLFRERSNEAKVRVGFTIQGESNDELPENIFACCKITNVSLNLKNIKVVDFK